MIFKGRCSTMNKLITTVLVVFLPFLLPALLFVMMLLLMLEKKVKQESREEKQDKRIRKVITALAYTMITTGGVSTVAVIIASLITTIGR